MQKKINNKDHSYLVKPHQSLQGEIILPGDKSISHRALILASLAHGKSTIENFLESEDCLHTLQAMRQLGVKIEQQNTSVIVHGQGKFALKKPSHPINCGNSATSMRLLAGILSAQNFESTLIGDESLSQRPMQRIIQPLTQMQARISAQENNFAPLAIQPSKLKGIQYQLPIASAQVKSAILLAGLFANGDTNIIEPIACRDHTERLLQHFGANINIQNSQISLSADSELQARDIQIPGDFSSAAFFIVAATLIPSSHILLKNVGVNPTRTGLITLLKQMGANIQLHNLKEWSNEPVADIEIKSADLTAITVPEDLIVSMIDEFPIFFIAAACAKGVTILRNAAELRVKETDRIAAMATNLSLLGIKTEILADGIKIEGGKIQGGEVESFADHRIAMAFTIAGGIASENVTIHNTDCVKTSFPNFIELAEKLELKIR